MRRHWGAPNAAKSTRRAVAVGMDRTRPRLGRCHACHVCCTVATAATATMATTMRVIWTTMSEAAHAEFKLRCRFVYKLYLTLCTAQKTSFPAYAYSLPSYCITHRLLLSCQV